MKASVTLGKSGITEAWLEEVRRRLKKEKLLKVRVARSLIRSGLKAEVIAKEVADRLEAEIIDVRGHTFTLKCSSRTCSRQG
ncbi:MAG: YhbY family RNA-binding protein [Desulfurococcales archaeon]|nr:YhbY family RNA-binding protein [Desulfurococcales archaeon]